MLKIYDKNHNAIGHIVKYKDCKIESEVATGDKTLSFVYLAKHHSLQNEMYVQTKDDEYVIKEVPATTGAFPQIVAVLNLEDLQRDMWQTFSVADITIDEAVRTVLAGTGWTIGECNVTKKRNAGMMQVSTLEVIQNLCTAFMCEPVFDTINKTVSFYSQRGEDKGVYFMSGLNLKKLQKKSTSYDYYTRIIPIGQNNLSIADVNNGQNYLENYQYSDKILTYIWKDESYTDAQALMEDAQLKLNDLSKPEVSYSADVRDLAKQKSGYNVLSYNLGDTVTIIDQETGTRERQRIKKMVEYPQDPEKNTCEIANTVLTFEEMQQKYQAAINIINNTVTGEGRYTGTINVSDILNFESGIAGSSTISGISNNITGMQGELAGIKLTLGEVETNYLKVDEAELKYATIENLNVVREDVHELNADYGSFKTATADEFAAHTARIDTVVGDLASYKTTVTDELIAAKGWMAEGAIGDAQISSVNANKLQSGTIDTALVTIVGSDGRLQIADNTMQISDANRVRVQVGKDSSGDYTLAVWDKAGNLIWDALGATDKTIQRKIIRDNVIADDAAIQALKIDFQSLDTVLTDQGVTISGTVVQVGSKTLNVALSEQAQINTNYSEQLTSHSSKIAANEKAIALKVSSQTYEKDKTSMESSLQTLESSVNVMDGQITALVQDVTVLQGDYDGLDSRTAKLELDSSNFAVELSSTKKTVSDNYTSLKEYTDSAKASAISTAASDATTKADNALAAAKTDATTKANAALASAMTEIDATNAVVTTHTTTLSKHDTRITANENAISLKVWSQDITDAVAGIEVGGRNLLLDSKTLSSKHWYTSENPTIDDDGFSYVRLLNTWNNYIAQTVALEIGKYTFSFYAKAEKNETLEIKDDSLNQYVIASISINDSSWKKYTVTAKITKNTANPRISFLTRQNTAAIYIKKIKLERGTKATDWTPAPEDVDSAIATVDGKFASYSTTTEMQSAIEIAKSEINLSVSETYTTKTELSSLKTDVSNAKLGNLVKNGYGEYLDNTNFTDGKFTRGDCPEGCYGYFTNGATELIPFDPTAKYDLSYYCRRNVNASDSDVNYFSIVPIDIDGNIINVRNVISDEFDGNLYYLSKDLQNGDTVAYFTDLSKWVVNTTKAHQRSILIFGYKDGTGYTYPDGTYSRKTYDNVYASNESVDKTNNTITLTKTWSGGTVKAGTCIGHVKAGSTYCYFGQQGKLPNTTDWKKWSVSVYADANSQNYEYRRLAYAKNIKIFLFNNSADYAGIHLSKTVIDVTAQSKITTLETWKTEASQKITKDGIIATVGNYYAYQSDLASAENRITDAETTIAQQADAISLKVSKGDIISTINQSAEEVKINAAKITLEGATIADSFTATNLTVTGNSVFSGKLSGATGDFSGKITATSGKIGDWNIGGSINATNSKGNYIYLGAGTSSNQDVLYVRTGTDSSSYKWPIILRATGEAIFSNATVTGNITATSIKLSDTVSIYKPSTSQYVTLINQASENINLGLMFSSITTPNIVSTGSVWAQNTTYGGQFNAVSGDYGVMLRNDGNAFYILLSNAGDQTSFNALRPLFINLTDGKVTSQTEFWCTCHGVSGTRRPVVSASTNGTRVSYIASKTNSSGTHFLTVNGQYGTEGSTYNSYNISCTTSDARLKTNVLDTDINALAVINQMQIRQFNWKENGIHQKIGFVADELELLDPALAIGGGYDEDGVMDVKSVNDFYLLGYLTKGIQELYSAQLSQADKLFTHKSQIDYLLDENAALKKRVKELEKQIA